MKKSRLGLSILTIVMIVFGCKYEINIEDRIINDSISLKEDFTINHEYGYIIRMYADDSLIYCSSAPDFKIYIYTMEGKLKRTLGKKGPAPWENNTLWYFNRINKDYYWVHDYPKQILKKYLMSKDSMVKSLRIATSNNVVCLNDESFIVPQINEKNDNLVFNLINVNENIVINKINVLDYIEDGSLKDLKYLDHVLEGDFCKSNGKIVYYCYKSGIFILIDEKNLNVEILHDYRDLGIPRAAMHNGQIHYNVNQVVTLSASLDNNFLYALSTNDPRKRTKRGKYFFIDKYDLESKKYINSILLPKYNNEERPMRIIVIDNRLVVLYEYGKIVGYRIVNNKIMKLNEKN